MNDDDMSLLWEVVDAARWTLAVYVFPLLFLALWGFLPGAAAFAAGLLLVQEGGK